MILLIITRILDVITTILNINKYGGWGVELNPTMRWIGEKGLFIPYQILALILVILTTERLKHKKTIYRVFSILSLVTIIINVYCLTL